MPELQLHDCKRYQFIYFMSTQKFSLVGYDPKDTVTFYMTENASTFYQTAGNALRLKLEKFHLVNIIYSRGA